MKEYNLNKSIKVKLTPLGVDIYYHSFDQVRNAVPSINGMPKIDEDGFTEFSLWDFMHLYGKYIGIGKKEVLRECCIYLEDEYENTTKIKINADDIAKGKLTGSHAEGETKADKPSGKVYIATLKIKDKGNIARTNGGVFTTKEKAVESIKKRGFTLLSPYGDYRNPKDLKCIGHFYNEKEWMYYLEKRSHNEPTSELYKNMWLETVGYKENVSYWIEEHGIDISE